MIWKFTIVVKTAGKHWARLVECVQTSHDSNLPHGEKRWPSKDVYHKVLPKMNFPCTGVSGLGSGVSVLGVRGRGLCVCVTS